MYCTCPLYTVYSTYCTSVCLMPRKKSLELAWCNRYLIRRETRRRKRFNKYNIQVGRLVSTKRRKKSKSKLKLERLFWRLVSCGSLICMACNEWAMYVHMTCKYTVYSIFTSTMYISCQPSAAKKAQSNDDEKLSWRLIRCSDYARSSNLRKACRSLGKNAVSLR